MESFKDLPLNSPSSYREVEAGDLIVMLSGQPDRDLLTTQDGVLSNLHIHLYEVVHKDTRYALLTLKLNKCIFKGKPNRGCFDRLEKNWSWFVSHREKMRWLRSPSQKILFGVTNV